MPAITITIALPAASQDDTDTDTVATFLLAQRRLLEHVQAVHVDLTAKGGYSARLSDQAVVFTRDIDPARPLWPEPPRLLDCGVEAMRAIDHFQRASGTDVELTYWPANGHDGQTRVLTADRPL